MRVCDVCKCGKDNELYVVHTAIYINRYPSKTNDIPDQVNPNEAELCKACYDKLTNAMRNVKTIIESYDNAQKYYTSLYDSPGGRGRC